VITADDVIRVTEALAAAGVAFWLDGGWGVDALLGDQTRPHDDLDLVIALDRCAVATAALAPLGYTAAIDERPTRLVLEDQARASIDLHTVTFDAEGGGLQRLPNGGAYRYPPRGFNAHGLVGGAELPCVGAEVQFECHLGYVPGAKDHHDMRLLARRFGLKLPPPYASGARGANARSR
jgi:lincosamide nucleotidyltransferase A/C/D/E